MTTPILDRITCPNDLKSLSSNEVQALASEIRGEMVAVASERGGHLAPSLGAVEIILALHRVLDCPKDRIVFDVGHQAYAHKIITGRREQFKDLRAFDGLSGFPKIDESPYDSHNSGHASDSLSTALGYALARDIDGRDETIAVVVGDASFTGGMSLEALNEIGHKGTKLIIILNDNGMSISVNVGGFSNFLGKVRLSERYQDAKENYEASLDNIGKLGKFLKHGGDVLRDSVKQMVMPEGEMFFEGFGVTYVGPIDGHDEVALEEIIRDARDFDGPVLIHVVTTKGKGYAPAEKHPDQFHGVGPFDIESGKRASKSGALSWTSVFSDELCRLAEQDDRIVAITAAMPDGTGLASFGQKFPERCFDVGIAEENAVGMASSMAMSGKVPFVALYSTFAQRAYDQAIINVALQNQHVVFCLDRAGLVGEDGPTHHGAFDLSYMRTVPGMTILAPSTDQELRDALDSALSIKGPVCVRYPRGGSIEEEPRQREIWNSPGSRKLRDGYQVAVLAVGTMVKESMKAAELLSKEGISCAVWDMRWVKPVDSKAVADASEYSLMVTVEENSIVGGFGSAVLEELSDQGRCAKLLRLGLPDDFIQQGSVSQLRRMCGLDSEGIAQSIREAVD